MDLTMSKRPFRFINVLLVIRHNDMEANLAVLGYVSFFLFLFLIPISSEAFLSS